MIRVHVSNLRITAKSFAGAVQIVSMRKFSIMTIPSIFITMQLNENEFFNLQVKIDFRVVGAKLNAIRNNVHVI